MKTKQEVKTTDKNKKKVKLNPYKEYLNSKNQAYEKYKQKYFEYHDDVKDKTHKIIDW